MKPQRQLTTSVQNVLTENDNYVTKTKEKQVYNNDKQLIGAGKLQTWKSKSHPNSKISFG